MNTRISRMSALALLVVLTLAVSACNNIYLPPPPPPSDAAEPPAADQSVPAETNKAEVDITGEVLSMIVDAPGSYRANQIANAMSAAPLAVSRDATIIDFPTSASDPVPVLRVGTNGWTCYTDWPGSPGNDPECNDPIFEAWLGALFAGEPTPPAIDGPGIAYMLQGGSDPSNTDPMAAEPAADEDWVISPAHVMLVVPGGFDTNDFTTDPYADQPWIMWEGTAYEHLMIPVDPMKAEDMGDADAMIRNTMSAAPAGIVRKAKILGNPATNGGEMVTLQEGDSGWVCWPDRSVSPGNDPACSDPVWEALSSSDQPVPRAAISYMLAGGSDESNTDPTATGPAPGEDWITTPPHLMLLVPGGFDAKLFSTDPESGYPYIMWDGTPYEHLMIPVADRSM
ncbi:MAG: hypothetical protein J5I90_21800 [Caldilineales bacterium]|nr:hypothetical protein [Caldilineales bacterium]